MEDDLDINTVFFKVTIQQKKTNLLRFELILLVYVTFVVVRHRLNTEFLFQIAKQFRVVESRRAVCIFWIFNSSGWSTRTMDQENQIYK